jgi:hypothetical protein
MYTCLGSMHIYTTLPKFQQIVGSNKIKSSQENIRDWKGINKLMLWRHLSTLIIITTIIISLKLDA